MTFVTCGNQSTPVGYCHLRKVIVMELNLVQKVMMQSLGVLLVFLGLSTLIGQTVKTDSMQAHHSSVLSQ